MSYANVRKSPFADHLTVLHSMIHGGRLPGLMRMEGNGPPHPVPLYFRYWIIRDLNLRKWEAILRLINHVIEQKDILRIGYKQSRQATAKSHSLAPLSDTVSRGPTSYREMTNKAVSKIWQLRGREEIPRVPKL